jgi:hypothetical protein
MRVRFQADADLNLVILLALIRREPAVDFQSSASAGLARRTDPEVLAAAAREGRILVTHDQRTMPNHFGRFIATQKSPGLLVVPQHVPVSAVVEDLLLIWGATQADEWTNRVCYLPL